MQKRIVLVGAGSAQFGYGTIGDILQSEVLAGSHIVLHDINPDSMAVVEETGRAFIEAHALPFTISATTDRAEALKNADYVIISIEVGDRFQVSPRTEGPAGAGQYRHAGISVLLEFTKRGRQCLCCRTINGIFNLRSINEDGNDTVGQ